MVNVGRLFKPLNLTQPKPTHPTVPFHAVRGRRGAPLPSLALNEDNRATPYNQMDSCRARATEASYLPPLTRLTAHRPSSRKGC